MGAIDHEQLIKQKEASSSLLASFYLVQ